MLSNYTATILRENLRDGCGHEGRKPEMDIHYRKYIFIFEEAEVVCVPLLTPIYSAFFLMYLWF